MRERLLPAPREPRPKLCTASDTTPAELAFLWFELRTAIWKLDLGEVEGTRLEKEVLRLGATQRGK